MYDNASITLTLFGVRTPTFDCSLAWTSTSRLWNGRSSSVGVTDAGAACAAAAPLDLDIDSPSKQHDGRWSLLLCAVRTGSGVRHQQQLPSLRCDNEAPLSASRQRPFAKSRHASTVWRKKIVFSVLTVPLTKVLNHFSYVHTQIVLDTQTHRHTHTHPESHTFPSVSLFLKGLPPKQPEGFGCFVCPN